MQIGTGLQSCVLKEIIYILKEKQKITVMWTFSPPKMHNLCFLWGESQEEFIQERSLSEPVLKPNITALSLRINMSINGWKPFILAIFPQDTLKKLDPLTVRVSYLNYLIMIII